MRNRLVLLLFIVISQLAEAQNTSGFSSMEVNHVSAKTPGLFAGRKSIYLNLDSLSRDYAFPLPGGKVISGYGTRGGHSGDDIKTRANDTIRAVCDGVVRMAKLYGAYGNVIVVRHPNGLETVYSHNSRNLIKSGDVVKTGQAIALTGRTGRATTEHIHFETRINGKHFNPGLLFNMQDRTLQKGFLKCTQTASGIVVKPLNSKEVPTKVKPLNLSLYKLTPILKPVWDDV
ncbi:M23 family metallopeptidase [Bacteroides sp.]